MNSLHHLLVVSVLSALGTIGVAGVSEAADNEPGDEVQYAVPGDHTGDAPSEISGMSKVELTEALEARFPLRIVDSGRWESSDLRSVLRGASILPDGLWEAVDGPIELEYVERRCMFSMGRYNDACPTFSDDGTRFFIYDKAPLSGEGPVERLEMLSSDEQRDIELRRAVVHLVMVQLDEIFEWSTQRQWRAINGWPDGGVQALNRDPWGFSRYLGMRSSRLDLVTFAEEFFVRPEDLLLEGAEDDAESARRLEDVDPDQTVTCQQFTRRRMLNRWLSELDEHWSEPRRPLPRRDDEALCPAFEDWARPEDLEAFDILLAAATADQPESLFGHLLLHVRYSDADQVHSQGFEPVYQFGAITDTDVDPVQYITRGLLGGFPSILELNTFRGIDRLFLQYQQRDIRRYRLRLSGDQSRQILERIWEAERRIRYPYLFLSDNCASFLLDLLAPAIDVDMPERYGTIVMPTDVLDILSEIDNPQLDAGADRRLLEKRPEDLRSNRQVAEESVLQRRVLREELVDELEEDSERRRRFQELIDELESVEPRHRNEAYGEVAQLLDQILVEQPDLAQKGIDFLYHSVLIERYFVEMSHFARRSVYATARGEEAPQTIDDILQRRREIYQTEDMDARQEAFNETTLEYHQQLADAPDEELTPDQQEVIEYDEYTQRAYYSILDVQSSMIDDHMPQWSGVEYLEERSREYRERQQRIDELSKGPSGRNRTRIGAGLPDDAQWPSVRLSYSMMEDRLGEIRRRGYRGDLGTRILGLDATIPTTGTPLSSLQIDVVLLKYASLRQVYGPLRQGLLDRIGWSVDARLTHDGRRDLWASAELTPSALIPIFSNAEQVHHLVAEAGLGARFDVFDDQNPLLGATLGLFGQVHLYGDYANVLRVRARTGQFAGLGPQWRYDVDLRAESRHALFYVNERPMVIVPFAEALWTTRDYREDAPSDGFRSWQFGIDLELPL